MSPSIEIRPATPQEVANIKKKTPEQKKLPPTGKWLKKYEDEMVIPIVTQLQQDPELVIAITLAHPYEAKSEKSLFLRRARRYLKNSGLDDTLQIEGQISPYDIYTFFIFRSEP